MNLEQNAIKSILKRTISTQRGLLGHATFNFTSSELVSLIVNDTTKLNEHLSHSTFNFQEEELRNDPHKTSKRTGMVIEWRTQMD